MSTIAIDKCSGQSDGSHAVRQGNDQQLMSITHIATIGDQANFSIDHPLEDGYGDGSILLSHPNNRIVQEATQSASQTKQASISWDLFSDLAQMN
jgi:hypothetical protein